MSIANDVNYMKTLEESLTEAIADGSITIYLQPQFNSVSGEMVGAECLARWKHRTMGELAPSDFIPALEKLGRIYELDRFVWETACGLLNKWKRMGKSVSISVNVSRKDIEKEDLPTVFSELVAKYDIEPKMLRLEITESAYMDDSENLIKLVNRLVALGFSVEMDDFGTGFSSLSLLHDLYVDVLKLDMGFLKATESNKRSGNIINAIVKMAHTLDMKVIAEGVETASQAEFLKNIGCLIAQGYYYSRPVPIEEFEKLLSSNALYDLQNHSTTDELFNVGELFDRTSSGYFIFNNCMGSAALLELANGELRTVVANDKFVEGLECDREQLEKHRANLFNVFSEKTRKKLMRMAYDAKEAGRASDNLYSTRMKKYVHVKLRYMGVHDNEDLYFCEIYDITNEVKVQRKIERAQKEELEKRRYEKKLQVVLQIPGVVLYEYDPYTDEMIVSVRGENGELRERAAENYLEKLPERNWIHPDDVDRFINAIKSIKGPNDYGTINVRAITKEGVFSHAKYYLTSFCDDEGKLVKVMGRAELTDADTHDTYMENLPVGTFRYLADDTQQFEYVGMSVLKLLGFENEKTFREAYNNNFRGFIYEEDRERTLAARAEQLREGKNYFCEYRVIDAKHQIRWMYDAGLLSIDEKGVKKYNVALSDMNRYKEEALRREKRIKEEAEIYKENSGRDMMTGLYNHNESLKIIQECMDRGEKGIFAMLDIDDFKTINDTHGHVFGDQAICGLADGLKSIFRGNDVVGRYGGDEFLFFIKGTTNKRVANRKAKEILSMAGTVLAMAGECMSLSIGIVSDSSKAGDVTELSEMADKALYLVKKSGKGNYGFYEP